MMSPRFSFITRSQTTLKPSYLIYTNPGWAET